MFTSPGCSRHSTNTEHLKSKILPSKSTKYFTPLVHLMHFNYKLQNANLSWSYILYYLKNTVPDDVTVTKS